MLSNGDTLTLSGITNIGTTGWLAETASDGSGGTEIFLASVCYASGTRILTVEGEKTVESLREGDAVLTMSGDRLVPQPVKWVGRRSVNLNSHPRPDRIAPIRIRRDAFADGMPQRDLMVSPDHAIFVDGKLICARQLVNGTTIRQENSQSAVDYYHVELHRHAILLAEGLPAESYIDTGNRGFFDNSRLPLVLHPDLADGTVRPTREAGSCAPFVWDEASVRPVWRRLVDRASAIGLPVPLRATTTDANPRFIADRRIVRAVYSDANCVMFVLPRGVKEGRLLSRSQSPTEARPWLEDRRRLGICVKRIVLRSASELREISMDHPDLTEGWWDIERDGLVMSRWTTGDAVVPLPAMEGLVRLELHLAGGMIYALEEEPESEAERRAA